MQFGAKTKISSGLLENVTLINLNMVNTNLTGFSFSQNLGLILGNFEQID